MTVGLVGEYPTDTGAVGNLLSKEYPGTYKSFLRGIHGSQLDARAAGGLKRILRREFEVEKPDLVLFVRDLDAVKGMPEYAANMKFRKSNFSAFNRIVDKRGLLLLNIYELEALILADLEVFRAMYEVKVEITDRPQDIPDPKGLLQHAAKGRYNQSHNAEIFKQLRPEIVSNNCDYFRKFLGKFEGAIAPLNGQ